MIKGGFQLTSESTSIVAGILKTEVAISLGVTYRQFIWQGGGKKKNNRLPMYRLPDC